MRKCVFNCCLLYLEREREYVCVRTPSSQVSRKFPMHLLSSLNLNAQDPKVRLHTDLNAIL